MRKYDIRNKRNFVIIGIILLIIIVVFSFFIYKFINKEKKEYEVEIGSVLFDSNKELITTKKESYIKTKWNDNYYLYEEDNNILLGKHAIVFNEESNSLSLYGKYFEVNKNDVIIHNDETIIKNTGISKFYKLEDRKYLVVDKTIESSDKAFSTSNYLLVELDKKGNATLTNNNINLKTISKTNIVTSSYTFNISEEKLIYEDITVDLSKIIGSSNEYKESNETSSDKDEDSNEVVVTSNGNSINTNTEGSVVNTTENTDSKTSISTESTNSMYTITSVVGISSSLTNISIDYVIYDPNNKYSSNYVLVYDALGKYINKYKLKENSTNLLIDGLDIDTKYSLIFKNEYETGEEETFYNASVSTNKPVFGISITKVSTLNNKLSYKVLLDSDYLSELNEGTISAQVKLNTTSGSIVDTVSKTFTSSKVPKSISGSINMPNLVSGEVVSLELSSITINDKTINIDNVYYKYKND